MAFSRIGSEGANFQAKFYLMEKIKIKFSHLRTDGSRLSISIVVQMTRARAFMCALNIKESTHARDAYEDESRACGRMADDAERRSGTAVDAPSLINIQLAVRNCASGGCGDIER